MRFLRLYGTQPQRYFTCGVQLYTTALRLSGLNGARPPRLYVGVRAFVLALPCVFLIAPSVGRYCLSTCRHVRVLPRAAIWTLDQQVPYFCKFPPLLFNWSLSLVSPPNRATSTRTSPFWRSPPHRRQRGRRRQTASSHPVAAAAQRTARAKVTAAEAPEKKVVGTRITD